MSAFGGTASRFKGSMIKAGFQSRISNVERHDTGNSFDMFFWGVIAGVAGTIIIMFYVFYSS